MEYVVEKIHSSKKKNDKKMYLVEWKDYPDKKDYTWEPIENLDDCTVFQEYKRKRKDSGIMVKEIFKKNKREALSKDERFDIIRLQNYKCNLCLNHIGSSFDIDHLIPLEQGGTYDLSNLQALCNSCHIFKTTVLDRGVIVRLLQAKIKTGKDISKIEILEECQMVFINRNRHRVPFHDDEMLEFSISAVDIFKEMCRKKKAKTGYLKNINSIIKNMTEMKCKSTVISMDKCNITIEITDGMYDEDIISENLNLFFKEIYENKVDNCKKTFSNIAITYN